MSWIDIFRIYVVIVMPDKFTVFFDDNKAYPIKIHKIECTWRRKYEEHSPTSNTEWNDVSDFQTAKRKANEISKENNNRKIVIAKCGGNCFSRNHTQ